MKGIILAGGLGSRLYPLTYATNKHLLPIYDKPMVYYPIQTLLDAGIDEILIITGGPHAGHFLRTLKNGEDLGIKHLEYAYQEGAGGIPKALILGENFADGESVCVILGDNCTDTKIEDAVKEFKNGASVFLKEVPDPERFGVPVFDKDGNIVNIEEKPKDPKSKYAITGLYLYDNTVFDKIRTLNPSKRGELEVTDLNNLYLKQNKLKWTELEGFWSDAGSFDTLLSVGQYWKTKK